MTPAEKFLHRLEARGLTVGRHVRGGFLIAPPGALTADERAELKNVASDLEQLLAEREAQGLKPADAMMLHEAQKKFPGSRLVGIRRRRTSNWPELEPPAPAAVEPEPVVVEPGAAVESKEPQEQQPPEVEQLPLSLSDSPASEPPSSEQPADPEPEPPAAARICSSCQHPCYDPLIIHCRNCDELLPDEIAETSTQDGTALSRSDTSTDEPTPVSAELVGNEKISWEPEPVASAPEPEPEAPTADPAGDPEQSSDESSVPAIYEVEVPITSSTETVYEAEMQPDRSQRILLWVTADIVRSRRTGRPLIALKVSPSPSINTNGDRPVRFTIEESTSSAVHRYKLFKGPTNLARGFRLVTPAAALRLAREMWR
jgi:hypothetical protein